MARLVESGAGLDGALFVVGYGKEEIKKLLENAPLVAPIFLKAGGVGRAETSLLGQGAEARDMGGGDVGATWPAARQEVNEVLNKKLNTCSVIDIY